MTKHKILFLNIGYARGLTGKLAEHIRYAHRNIYCPPEVQRKALGKLNQLIEKEDPDICCFVEIDQGLGLNQAKFLLNKTYPFHDVENKYGPKSMLRSFALTAGKSNGFIAKTEYPFEKLFFSRGTKRLIYKITLAENLTLFFAHFSLKKSVRATQLNEAHELMKHCEGEVIFMGDFNILTGLDEIRSILKEGHFVLLNKMDMPTFFFHKEKHVIDLCICSKQIAAHSHLDVQLQSFTDHAALVLTTS